MTVRLVVTVPWGARLGGAESMLWTFLEGLDRTRISPLVVFFGDGPFERDVSRLGCETAVIATGRLRQPIRAGGAVAKLASLLRREQPHLLLNWSPKTQLYGAVAAARAGMRGRVVWWQHGHPVGHWLDRLATALPTLAIGCSSVASARAQEGLWPRRRTFVVHPGVVVPQEGAGDGAAVRDELGIPPSRTVLGIVGRLEEGKGQDQFIRVLHELRSQGLDVHGLIVGGDAYELSPAYSASLAPLARELGVGDCVTLTGQVEDTSRYLDAMDILISASQSEAFGIAILEAMAAGVPVVAASTEGPDEMIEPGRTGVLVHSGAPRHLAAEVASLIQDRDRREQFSAQARERARARFSAELMVEGLTAELEALAGETG